MKDYAEVARPLYQLLKCVDGKPSKGKKAAAGKIAWDNAHRVAFDRLIDLLTTGPPLDMMIIRCLLNFTLMLAWRVLGLSCTFAGIHYDTIFPFLHQNETIQYISQNSSS